MAYQFLSSCSSSSVPSDAADKIGFLVFGKLFASSAKFSPADRACAERNPGGDGGLIAGLRALDAKQDVACADGIAAALQQLDQMHAEFRLHNTGGLSFAQGEDGAFEFLDELSPADEPEIAAELGAAGILRMTFREFSEVDTRGDAVQQQLRPVRGWRSVRLRRTSA